jgi:hypothetical protein
MAATFLKLAQYMRKQKTNEYVAARATQHNIPDIITKGMSIYLKETLEETLTTEDDDGETGIASESAMGIEDNDDLEGL